MSPSVATAMFWLAATCCVAAQFALVVSSVRSPMSGSADSADLSMPRRSGEIAWTIIPAIGLAVLLVFTWRAMHTPAMTPDMPAAHRMIDQ